MKIILSGVKHSIRSIFKNFRYWIINFSGFTISIAIVILTASYALFLYNADNHHENIEKISIISMSNEEEENWIGTPWYIAQKILPEIPEVEASCRIFKYDEQQYLAYATAEPKKTNLSVADTGVVKVFTLKPIGGDVKKALKAPSSLVLTQSEARKYFGDKNPIGEQLLYNGKHYLTVNAVIKDLPKNSLFSYAGLISSSTMDILSEGQRYDGLGQYNYQTFAMTRTKSANDKIAAHIAKKVKEIMRFESKPYVELIPLKELFFRSDTRDTYRHGNKSSIMVLLGISFSVLLLAMINFINLEFVRFSQKINSLFIRRISGGSGVEITLSAFIEAIGLSLLAFFVAFVISNIVIFSVDGGTPSVFDRSIIQKPVYIAVMLGFSVMAGILSGIPTTIMALRKNINSVRSANTLTSKDGKWIQQGLAVFQFVVAIALITYTLGSFKQQNFIMKNFDVGFDANRILCVNTYGMPGTNNSALENKLIALSNVVATASCFEPPGSITQHASGFDVETRNGKKTRGAYLIVGSEKLAQVFDFDIKYGSIPDIDNSERLLIINEAAMKEFEISPSEIGNTAKIASWWGEQTIDAVCKDFNFQSLHQTIKPLIIIASQKTHNILLVKFNSTTYDGIKNMLSEVKSIVSEVNPGKPFDYSFMDERLAVLYARETENFRILIVATLAAVIIALLGLYGLSMFMTDMKTKEIGIRKINGAKIYEIIQMLNLNFLKWVFVAFLIATPVAYYILSKWLEKFAYKTELSWWIFALAGVFALGIALLTVSWQSWRAATRNPVEALRYE